MYAMASSKAVQVARAAISGRLAPSCWPTIVNTASPMPIIGTQATLLTLKANIVPAWLIVAQPANQGDKEREGAAFDEPLQAARRTEGPQSPQQRGVPAPPDARRYARYRGSSMMAA